MPADLVDCLEEFREIIDSTHERHDDPNTPDKYKIETEPHHHHYVPGDRSKRQENRDTRTLKSVLKVVEHYIINNKSYP